MSTPAPSAEVDASASDASDASDASAVEADAGVDAAPSCVLPGQFGSASCEACLSARCCDVILTCDHDADCHGLLACTRACLLSAANASACIDKCKQDMPAGVQKYNAFDSCVAAAPPAGCAFDCSQ